MYIYIYVYYTNNSMHKTRLLESNCVHAIKRLCACACVRACVWVWVCEYVRTSAPTSDSVPESFFFLLSQAPTPLSLYLSLPLSLWYTYTHTHNHTHTHSAQVYSALAVICKQSYLNMHTCIYIVYIHKYIYTQKYFCSRYTYQVYSALKVIWKQSRLNIHTCIYIYNIAYTYDIHTYKHIHAEVLLRKIFIHSWQRLIQTRLLK